MEFVKKPDAGEEWWGVYDVGVSYSCILKNHILSSFWLIAILLYYSKEHFISKIDTYEVLVIENGGLKKLKT